MSGHGHWHVTAEARARALVDAQLTAAGWSVQDRHDTNLFAAQGVAVREVPMAPGHGRADYLLYVDKRVVGVLEAKPEGTTPAWSGSRRCTPPVCPPTCGTGR